MIWGKADAGAAIKISFQGKAVEGKADDNGNFQVTFPALNVSAGEELCLMAGCEQLVLSDVAVGEVFVAGGQSNMEFWMRYEKHFIEEKPICENSQIRFFDVPEIAYAGQNRDFDYSDCAVWRKAAPDELQFFSAIGYYFAKELQTTLQIPIGIIGCNFGGTTVSEWISRDTLQKYGAYFLEEFEAWAAGTGQDEYWEKQHKNPLNDRGKPFDDPFNEFIMPRTPSDQEIGAFFANMAPSDNAPDFSLRKPETFPCALYDNMVKTIAPYAVRAVLWYQGESDDEKGHTELYEGLLYGLLDDWRALWNDNLPFFIVQLPGWRSWMGGGGSNWATIRAAQEKVCSEDNNAFLISIADVGEEFDIHPKNKKTVGHRIALSALGHLYGETVLCDAPVLSHIKRSGQEIFMTFENAGNGLYISGDALNALEVRENGESIPFQTEVKGDTVKITLDQDGAEGLEILFAQSMWYCVNLYGSSGIPAIPFRAKVN